MEEGYIRQRAELFGSEAVLASTINSHLHAALEAYGSPDGGNHLVGDIPIADNWSLAIYRPVHIPRGGPPANLGLNNRLGVPLEHPAYVQLQLAESAAFFSSNYTNDGATPPVLFAMNGAVDTATGEPLDAQQLSGFLHDLDTIIMPHLLTRQRSRPSPNPLAP